MVTSKSEVCRPRREFDIKRSETVLKRTYSESPGFGNGPEEWVNLIFKHLSAERGAIAGPFNALVEIISRIGASSVQFSHHLRESPLRNRFCDTAFPASVPGRGQYLKCTMDWLTGVHFDNSIGQFIASSDCMDD